MQKTLLQIRHLPSAFWILIAGTLLNQSGNMAFVFLIIYLKQYLGFTLNQAALAFAAFGFSNLISNMLGGTLIYRFGSTRIMIVVLIANGCILFYFPTLKHFFPILLSCLAWGFLYGIFRPASQTLVSFIAPKNIQKIIFSLYRWAINLGMSIGPAIGGYLAMHSFPKLFILNGCANILASIVFIIGFINTPWLTYRPTLKRKFEFSLKWLKEDAVLCIFVIGMILFQWSFFSTNPPSLFFSVKRFTFHYSFMAYYLQSIHC